MEEKTCETCVYFIQHYRKDRERYFPIGCGHCLKRPPKRRPPETPACERYQEVEDT